MYFDTKHILKNNHNHIFKDTLNMNDDKLHRTLTFFQILPCNIVDFMHKRFKNDLIYKGFLL